MDGLAAIVGLQPVSVNGLVAATTTSNTALGAAGSCAFVIAVEFPVGKAPFVQANTAKNTLFHGWWPERGKRETEDE